MADIKRARRYYLLKRRHFGADGVDFEPSLSGAYRFKQEAEPGTDLPAGFVLKAELAVLGYTTVEDLDGADEPELITAGLSRMQARAVLQDLSALL